MTKVQRQILEKMIVLLKVNEIHSYKKKKEGYDRPATAMIIFCIFSSFRIMLAFVADI